MKSASECPYCGVLIEEIPVEQMDVPDKNEESTV
jgi:hypothetical protein